MPIPQSETTKRTTGLLISEAVGRLKTATESARQDAPTPQGEEGSDAPTPEQEAADGLGPDETNLDPEESDAGGSDDEAAEAAADDDPDEDDDAKDPVFTAVIDGEEYEVPLSELIASWQRQGDYTKKTQALAEQRRALEDQAKQVQELHSGLTAEQQRIAKEREQYDAALEALQQVLKGADDEWAKIDWDQLYEEDPVEAAKQESRYRRHLDRKREAEAEAKRREEERKREAEEAQKRVVAEFQAGIAKHFPQWVDESVRSKDWGAMYKVAKSLDFTDDEIRSTTDVRIFRLLHKAMQFDRVEAAKRSATSVAPKKAAGEPAKVVRSSGARPATRAGATSSNRSIRDAYAKLRQSGNPADAARLLQLQRQANASASRRARE